MCKNEWLLLYSNPICKSFIFTRYFLKINTMKINHLIKTGILLLFFQSLSYFASSQAVFAPKIGAEWHYFFQTDSYNLNVTYFRPRRGTLKVSYTKDTLINTLIMKKFEQKEVFKNKNNDTLFTRILSPLYMIQKNDSVLLLVNDTLSLAFVYKTQIGAITKLRTTRNKYLFNLELQSLVDTTAINNGNLRFKKYTYKSSTPSILFDVYFTNPLIILDRIGAINADLSVLNSQGQSENYTDGYNLICYQDSEVGELKFANSSCDVFVSVNDLKKPLNDFNISYQDEKISISVQSNEFIKNVKIYDIRGRLVWNNTNEFSENEINIPKNELPQGLLIVNIESNSFVYMAKKIIIHH